MGDAYFFGYGSLVNRLTHGYAPVHRARLRGWRRGWRATAERKVAYLTAVADPGAEIDGLIAPVAPDAWMALDQRECAYRRVDATDHVVQQAGATGIAVYAIAPERMVLPTADHPVLLSYLDVVVQGYLAEYGPPGVAHFFATTDGWEAPFLDDRTDPRYPRAQRISEDDRAMVDLWLDRVGARRIAPA